MPKDNSKPPFRADHVGSFLRPAAVATARQQWQEGTLDRSSLQAVEDDCVRQVVAMQEALGLKGITDGDMRRGDWVLDFIYSIDGVEKSGQYASTKFSDGQEFSVPVPALTQKIRCPDNGILLDAFQFLTSVTQQTPKLAIPAPAMLYNSFQPAVIGTVYDDQSEFWRDVAMVYQQAIEQYAIAGCRYLQIDDVNAGKTGDNRAQVMWRQQGFTVQQRVEDFVAINNAALEKRPPSMTAAVHICRGNFQSQHMASGGYEMMAEHYFNKLNVDAFFLEYDDERSGGFEPLRFMPKNKVVVLGLLTTKTPQLEPKDVIKRRIEEATQYVELDRLCLSPQCGFASTHEGNKLSEDQQRRKLEHLVEIATEVWGGV